MEIIYIFLFFTGISLGSFLNVCIYRIPQTISIVRPGSFCPECKSGIAIYHNIPLISFLLLRGKCASCGSSISLRYPLIELVTGIMTILTFYKFGFSHEFIFYLNFIYFAILIGIIDYNTQKIHNSVVAMMLVSGILLNLLFPVITWEFALFGVIAGGSVMFLIAILGKLLFKKESMGMGDVKFSAAAGFFLGWKMVLISIYFGFILALLAIIMLKLANKIKAGNYIPFGPFIAAGLIIFVFFGNSIIGLYLRLIL
ncbi:MAG: A24 family peptidase [Calditrichaceae bacterium]